MSWSVSFVNDAARAEVKALPLDMSARFTRISDMIVEFGLLALREPQVKHLTGKLWEMRLKGRGWYCALALCDGQWPTRDRVTHFREEN